MKQINVAVMVMCLAAGAGLSAGVAGRQIDNAKKQVSLSESSTVEAAASPETVKPSYVLGENNGRVAVYLYGNEEPEIVFNVYLHHLPDVDRLNLQNGIEIDDYQTLLELIEDYTS